MYIAIYTDDEEWRPITYRNVRRGMYEASSYGRIRNSYTKKIMKQQVSEKGYMMVPLMCENDINRNHTFKTHKIIADTFLHRPIDPPKDGSVWTVDHIHGGSEGKRDCSIYNLRYLSDKENKRRITTDHQNTIRRGDDSATSKINSAIALFINDCLNINMTTPMIVSAVLDKFNMTITKHIVHDIRRGKTWKHITHR